MDKNFVGNNIIGNFKPSKDIDKLDGYVVEKHDNALYLVKDNESIHLRPYGHKATLVIANFSNEIGDLNESVYKLELNKGNVIIILYTYNHVEKLIFETQKIRIHLSRAQEKEIVDSGIGNLKVENKKQILPLLRELFINNKSIFIHADKKHQNSFQMFSGKHRARVEEERPGIYCIKQIYSKYNSEYVFDLTQIFGDIDFVSWEDSISLDGNPNFRLDKIKTNDVFEAWNEYTDFEETLFKENRNQFGLIPYKEISLKGENVIFKLKTPIDDSKVRELEFEFISSYSEHGETELPKNAQELEEWLNTRTKIGMYLGKILNETKVEDELVFEIPPRFFNNLKEFPGILYMSNASLRNESIRRRKVLKKINSKANESSNIIMRLSDPNVVDSQSGGTLKPIDDDIKKLMFGTSKIDIKENYREAMSIAINTPDIALIQGPPGTGKTTLITGIIARLRKLNKNYRILVSAEQHVALRNVVDKVSVNEAISPFVTSTKFDSEDEEAQDFEKIATRFQTKAINLCDEILDKAKKDDDKSSKIVRLMSLIQEIKDKAYATTCISQNIDEINKLITELNLLDYVNDELQQVFSLVDNFIPDDNPLFKEKKEVADKLKGQRTNYKVYIQDDGKEQLESLQEYLENHEYLEFLMRPSLKRKMLSNDIAEIQESFSDYVDYVNNLKDEFTLTGPEEFDKDYVGPKEAINNLSKIISKGLKEQPKDLYDIVETMKYRLNDIDVAADIIKEYSSVVGSTCAQAQKSLEAVNLEDSNYDYVIIDEAARANPLDIMIPMMLGVRVILVGDHKQLPHYIESTYVKIFEKSKAKYSNFDSKLLTKSLFQIIYENLEKAYKENRIKFKRTIQLSEQYRMNPVIGSFISNEFYGGTIDNGENTVKKINDFNICDGKNIAWYNVPVFSGMEQHLDHSLFRPAEISKILELLRELVSKNPNRKLDIGIISYYKKQAEMLKNEIDTQFPKAVLDVTPNTVDSYQGKEFDIVIISGVRSNTETSPESSLGFIHDSPSRINVSLSRAKKLLIFVGDKSTFRKTTHFASLINYIEEVGYNE